MNKQFRDRLQRLHDAHQRGRETEGGPSGVYSAGGDIGGETKTRARRKRTEPSKGWEALGALRCDDFEEPYYVYSTCCEADLRHGEWTIGECLAAEHHKLCALDEDVPAG